jgi:hypothetical protein
VYVVTAFVFRAKIALDDCRNELQNCSYSCPVLDVSGVDHFNHSVVFAKVAPNTELRSLNMIAGRQTRCDISVTVVFITSFIFMFMFTCSMKVYCVS